MPNSTRNLSIEDLYEMFPEYMLERFGPYEDFIRPTAAVSPNDTWLFGLGNRYDSFGDMLARNLLPYDNRGNIKPGFLGTPYMLFKNTTKVPLTLEEQRLQAYNDALARNLYAVEDKINSFRNDFRKLTPEQLNIARTNNSGLSSPEDYEKKRNFLTKIVGLPEETGMMSDANRKAIVAQQAANTAFVDREPDRFAENSKNIIDKDVRISTTNRSVPVDFKIETPLERAERMFVNPVINAGKVVLDKAKEKIQDFSKNKGEEYKSRAAKNNQPPASVTPATIPGYPMGTRGY